MGNKEVKIILLGGKRIMAYNDRPQNKGYQGKSYNNRNNNNGARHSTPANATSGMETFGEGILKTLIPEQPTMAVWTLSTETISNFITAIAGQLDGYSGEWRSHVNKTNSARPEISIYLFFNENSKEINSSALKIPPHFKDRIRSVAEPSEALKHFMYAFGINSDIQSHDFGNGIGYSIQLDPIKLFAGMLGVVPHVHEVVIISAEAVSVGNIAVQVAKQYVLKRASTTDRLQSFVSRRN